MTVVAHRATITDPGTGLPTLTLWRDREPVAAVDLCSAQCVALASDLTDAARSRMGEPRGRWPDPRDQMPDL